MIFDGYLSLFYLALMHSSIISSLENFIDIYLMLKFIVSYGNKHFDVHFQQIRPVFFRWKIKKTGSIKQEMKGKLFNSRQSRYISLLIIMNKVIFSTFYLDLACKQLCFPPRKMYK